MSTPSRSHRYATVASAGRLVPGVTVSVAPRSSSPLPDGGTAVSIVPWSTGPAPVEVTVLAW